MTKERFTEILKEYNYSDAQIEILWEARPSDDINEESLRKVAKEEANETFH